MIRLVAPLTIAFGALTLLTALATLMVAIPLAMVTMITGFCTWSARACPGAPGCAGAAGPDASSAGSGSRSRAEVGRAAQPSPPPVDMSNPPWSTRRYCARRLNSPAESSAESAPT